MAQLKYRPDIDGLRALAVLAVIAFHFDNQLLSGGFIGVDIFFVISGYIITSVIYPQVLAGDFSFSEFYLKRIKRILPLFYLVALFSLIVASIIFTPDDFVGFADSLRYSSSFIANIYFEKHSGYFAPASETMPLLHIWSLSIEEQFYMLWPVALILGTRFLPKRILLAGLSSAVLLLAGYSEFLSLNNYSAAYYLIQSRSFELLLGAMLAVFLFIKKDKKVSFPAIVYQISGLLGLAGLFFLVSFLNKESVFPGFNALLVIIATALIILSGENVNGLAYRILSQSIMVFVGKLSYSLYLWHWPVLAFYRYYHIEFGLKGVWICAVTTLILSLLSWKFFEAPLRYSMIRKRYVYLFYLIIPIILSVTIAKVIAGNDGYSSRFSDNVLKLYQISKSDFDDEKPLKPQTQAYAPFEPYLFGDSSQPKVNSFLWGDSHAGHFRPFVDLLGKKYQFSSLYGGLGGCPPLSGVDLVKYGRPETACSKSNELLAKRIIGSDADLVFIAARWAMYTETTRLEGEKGSRVYLGDKSDYSESKENSRRAFSEGLERTVRLLTDHDRHVVLFKEIPSYPFYPSNCWIKKETYSWLDTLSCEGNQLQVDVRFAYANQIIDALAEKYPALIVISPKDILCTGVSCASMLGDIPLYKDNNHLNAQGARELLNAYFKTPESERLKSLLTELQY